MVEESSGVVSTSIVMYFFGDDGGLREATAVIRQGDAARQI